MENIPTADTASNNTIELLNGELPVVSDPALNASKADVYEPLSDGKAEVPRETINCDVIVVGAGFSGMTSIHRLRKQGLSVKGFE